jgi:hypothetical protein
MFRGCGVGSYRGVQSPGSNAYTYAYSNCYSVPDADSCSVRPYCDGCIADPDKSRVD